MPEFLKVLRSKIFVLILSGILPGRFRRLTDFLLPVGTLLPEVRLLPVRLPNVGASELTYVYVLIKFYVGVYVQLPHLLNTFSTGG